jgi:diadenylate cyclase
LIVKDYKVNNLDDDEIEDPELIFEKISNYSSDELSSLSTISNYLGHGGNMSALDLSISPRGSRLLRKIPRVPMSVIENIVASFENFHEILNASIEELDDVDGVGDVRAQAIKEGLKRLRDQVLLDRHI